MTKPSATHQPSPATTERKARLRRELRATRDALAARDRLAAARSIEARLAYLPQVEAASVVHCYVGIGNEVATEQLIRGMLERRQRVLAPRVKGQGELEHLEVTDTDALVSGPRGLRQPDITEATPVDLREVDAIFVPGLAFDRHGFRLGYGGGYYDRTLEELRGHARAIVVGLAFDQQLVDELPREAHDQPVDVLVTETQMIWTSAE